MDKEMVKHEQRRSEMVLGYAILLSQKVRVSYSRSVSMVKAFSEMGGMDSIINMQGMCGGEKPNSRFQLLDKPHRPILIR